MTDQKPMAPEDTEFGKGHASRQANRKVRRIVVPEFGTKKKPLVLYAYPLTVNDAIHLDSNYASTGERNVMQIIRQCMNPDGDQYFNLRDKVSLLNSPADVIGQLLIELNGASSSFDQELKKNNE